jgi:hypothetical protein
MIYIPFELKADNAFGAMQPYSCKVVKAKSVKKNES